MKIIYYQKERESFITPTFSFEEHCFYLPEKDILLCKNKATVSGAGNLEKYTLTDDVRRLDEAKRVVENNLRKKGELKFSGVKRFDYDSPGLQAMLKGKPSEPDLKKGIEDLIKKAGKR